MSVQFTRANQQFSSTNVNAGTGSITFEAWVYHDALEINQAYPVIQSNSYPSNAEDFSIRMDTDASKNPRLMVLFQIGAGQSYIYTNYSSALRGAWVYVRFTNNTSSGVAGADAWDATFTKITPSTSSSGNAAGARSNPQNLLIAGAYYNTSQTNLYHWWTGKIRNACLMSGVASDAESLARMKSSNPVADGLGGAGGFIRFWPLLNSTDTSETVGSTTQTFYNSPTTGNSDPPFVTAADCIFFGSNF